MSERFLVVIETQRVKSYLFASRFLRETRGASMLLDRLNRSKTCRLIPSSGRQIYLGGGSGRVLFTSLDAAQNFAQVVTNLYQDETGGANVSVEVVERHVQRNETFADWVARGVRESQRNKLGRVQAVPVLGGRWVRPCTSCGMSPAEQEIADIQGVHCLCFGCGAKRTLINNFYDDPKRNWDIGVPVNTKRLRHEWRDFVLTTLADTVDRQFGTRPLLVPQHFNDIGAESQPRNYMGFIYADANRMGDVVKGIANRAHSDEEAAEMYAAFSSIVDQATREAAVESVLDIVQAREKKTTQGKNGMYVPAEIIVAGGDDLVLAVPAHSAIPVAAQFIRRFQEHTVRLQHEWLQRHELTSHFAPEGLTTSAGIVISHASYPASQLFELAGDLMKLAKGRSAALAAKGHMEGTLDFAVLHEPGSERIKQRRKNEYTKSMNGHTLHLTERPYTATKAEELWKQIQALKSEDVPRSKLKALYPRLFQSVMQAQFDAATIKARLIKTRATEQAPALKQLMRDLQIFPFREHDGEWTTPLSEIIELYDFVPAQAQ